MRTVDLARLDVDPRREEPDPEVLDLDMLRSVSDNDRDFERLIVTDYLASAGNHVAIMAAAVRSRDVKAIRESAHALKGNSRTIGGRALGDACARLEALANDGDLAGAREALDALEAEHARLVPALLEYLRSLDSAA